MKMKGFGNGQRKEFTEGEVQILVDYKQHIPKKDRKLKIVVLEYFFQLAPN